eukprot:289338-Amphidinium_carterae.1
MARMRSLTFFSPSACKASAARGELWIAAAETCTDAATTSGSFKRCSRTWMRLLKPPCRIKALWNPSREGSSPFSRGADKHQAMTRQICSTTALEKLW